MKTATATIQKTAQQLIASLPPKCYSTTAHQGKLVLIAIIAGQSGFHVVPCPSDPQEAADYLNASLSITEAQVKAMVCGSQFGWHCNGADPANN